MGIDNERINNYNKQYSEYNAKRMALKPEREFLEKEIDRLCKELSEASGIEVNRNNIQQVYDNAVEKLNEKLRVGEEIFNRIKASENMNSQQYNNQQVYNDSQPQVEEQRVNQVPYVNQTPDELGFDSTGSVGTDSLLDSMNNMNQPNKAINNLPNMFGENPSTIKI